MAKISFEDDNKKKFEIDSNEIFDFNGDLKQDTSGSATFSDSSKLDKRVNPVKIQYISSDGKEISSEQALGLLKDQETNSGAERIVALDIELEATHSGPNDNDCIYYEDSMEADAESFMSPFSKPLLKNHNSYNGEPLGRITAFRTGPSNIALDRTAIFLTSRVTDKDAMEKFLDGRYQTFSIAGTMGTVTCGTCGKTILKDGVFKFCGHWRGETYNNKVCQWGVRDIRYNECSVVNNPADKYAMLTKVTVVTDGCKKKKDSKDSKEEEEKMANVPNATDSNTNTNSKIDEVLDFIHSLKDKVETKVPDTENKDKENDKKPEASDNADGDGENPDEDPNATQDSEEVKELKAKLEDAEKQAKDAIAEKEAAEIKFADAEKAKKTAEEEVVRLKDNLTTISEYSKSLIVDFLIREEQVKDEEIEARKIELMAKSTKELGGLKDSYFSKQKERTPGSVKNPAKSDEGIHDNENPDKKDASGDNKVADSNKIKKGIQSIVDGIIGL